MWAHVVTAVQWASNTAYRAPYGSTPFKVMYGRVPRSTFSTFASPSGGEWRIDLLDEEKLRQRVNQLLATPEQLHERV